MVAISIVTVEINARLGAGQQASQGGFSLNLEEALFLRRLVRIFSPYHVANRRFARDRQRQGALLYGFGGVGPPQNERESLLEVSGDLLM